VVGGAVVGGTVVGGTVVGGTVVGGTVVGGTVVRGTVVVGPRRGRVVVVVDRWGWVVVVGWRLGLVVVVVGAGGDVVVAGDVVVGARVVVGAGPTTVPVDAEVPDEDDVNTDEPDEPLDGLCVAGLVVDVLDDLVDGLVEELAVVVVRGRGTVSTPAPPAAATDGPPVVGVTSGAGGAGWVTTGANAERFGGV
jgi:hypothetical protein